MRLNKILLATSMLATFAGLASAASAQTTGSAPEAKEEKAPEVVVTGSRIRKTTITSASPIQVITAESSSLVGLSNATDILQGSTAASTATQINNSFTGFVVTGGPGVNTLSLRGLGASRTLVILNGKRVGPAGVRGTVGPFDLNTIPGALVNRYEVLLDGASSIYGSEAIAGVVNVITKKNYTGGNLYVNVSAPEQSGGETYNIALTQGFIKDRLHGMVGLEYFSQSALTLNDRTYSQCPQDYVFDATTGIRSDLIDPKTGTYRCNLLRVQEVNNLTSGRNYHYVDTAVAGGGYDKDDLAGLHRIGATYNPRTQAQINSTPSLAGFAVISPDQARALTRASRADAIGYEYKLGERTVISPVQRTNFTAVGGYDLTNNTEIYGEFLYNKRSSSQWAYRQLFPTISASNPNNIFKAGNPYGTVASSARSIIAIPSYNKQDVEYARGLVGIKGILPELGPIKGWTWDVYAQMSKSKGIYGGNFVYNDRVLATTAASTVCNTALLTTATACPTGGVQWFRKSTVQTGEFSAEESAFLFGYEEGQTDYEQKYIEADFSGDLFELPAGTLSAAVGFSYRTESLDDLPGLQQRTGNLWGSTSAGHTVGDDAVKEAFVEFSIPVLKNLPLIRKLDLEASTRYSDYDSYGGSSTYKVGADWAITKWLRLRASQGDSFRAPALYELYLANQTSFLGQSSIDPCYQYANSTNETVKANCASLGIADNYTAPGSSSALIYAGGGKGVLSAETGLNKTIGLVFTPSFIKFEASVDFRETTIENQVARFGAANILYQCYSSPNFSSPFCSSALFTRDLGATSLTRFNIIDVHDSYLNVAQQFQRGIDLTLSYRHDFGFGKLTVESDHSFILDWTYTLLNGSAPQDQTIFIGYPSYTGRGTVRFDKADYTFTWGFQLVGKSSEDKYWGTNVYNYAGSTAINGTPSYYKQKTEFYANHSLSVRKKMDKWAVTGTIRNVFDEAPPFVSTGASSGRLGTAALTSQYDLLGRTFNIQLERKW